MNHEDPFTPSDSIEADTPDQFGGYNPILEWITWEY